ncbi:shikimate dehydrogenase family protein [Lacinutrix iliipiscaria]|uniref:Shikimate dehydrogenase family protein n=1 Tax=Lacinutrix iliipiscaria TaxID=1230532 RepID=A0ABW5WSL4_9FLAO
MRRFGLIGKNIEYSFSKAFFAEKFKSEEIEDASYENFDLEHITDFPAILDDSIKGLNVTIPYKELIIPYLDKLDQKAKKIGAVNTIKITKKGKLKGYNTDYYGFKKSLVNHLKPHHNKALILGTGGASKAIAYALKSMNINYNYVSRKVSENTAITYHSLSEKDINNHTIIINCTPIGTSPNIEECPKIPYHAITKKHLVFDLIYNPKETTFLKLAKQKNATTINGLKMLELQAKKSWRIWNR